MANGLETTSDCQAMLELQHDNWTDKMACWVMGPNEG